MENLRVGQVTLELDDSEVASALASDLGSAGRGSGGTLAELATAAMKDRGAYEIVAYPETPTPDGLVTPGSEAMFRDLHKLMSSSTDLITMIHGYNVTWAEAVGTAVGLQIALNGSSARDNTQQVAVLLLTWPSDGQLTPWMSYKSDRADALSSGGAIGRALLKLRDFLGEVKARKMVPCGQDLHLLCHSMGNYVLQCAVERLSDHTPATALPRLFDQIWMCAPDVDDDVFEEGQPLARVHQIARQVTVYHNRRDKALVISDVTKGNPDRLGSAGSARPALLHSKVGQVDCAEVAEGLVEHSYYLDGHVLDDIRLSVDGVALNAEKRRRRVDPHIGNVWRLSPS